MKKIIIYILLTSYTIFASELKNNQTIILANTKNITNAKAFIRKNITTKIGPIFIINLDEYYVVAYGIYSSKKTASKKMALLSAKLKKHKPYRIILPYDLKKKLPKGKKIHYYRESKNLTNSIIKKTKIININQTKNTIDITKRKIKTNLTKTQFLDSISLGFGQNKLNNNVFKLGIQKDFTSNIYENENGYLKGFYDLSLNQWSYSESKIYGLAFSPVFEYYFNSNIKGLIPFIHIGIGAAYITKTSTENKNFSTHFQFEDRIGMGLLSKKYKLSFDYFHYSNGSIKKPNDGIDIILLNYMYRF